MLVTLANNQTIAANASATYTYSPNSVQKVFLRLEDADWEDSKITVQIGSKTICNGAMAYGLAGMTSLQSGFSWSISATTGFLSLDFGSHQCTNNDNLYVTVQAVGELSAVDVSAIVDSPGKNFPVKLTEYADSTFTSENNLLAVIYDNGKGEIEEDTNSCEIRTGISSSAPSITSSCSYYNAESVFGSQGPTTYFGLLNVHSVPLKTTYNYVPNTADRIITVEQMGTSKAQVAQARQSARVAVSQAGK